MTSLKITTRIDDRHLHRALGQLVRFGTHLRPAFQDMGEYLLISTHDRFEAQRAPGGTRWARLHPGTRAQKKNPRILTERGRLRGSISYRAGDQFLRWGTNVIYGAIHQFGGTTSPHVIRPKRKKALAWPGGAHPVKSVKHPGSKIPARPYLGLSVRDRNELVRILHNHYRRALKS